MDQQINLVLNSNEVQIILDALADQPFRKVNDIITKVFTQARSQVQEKPVEEKSE